MQKRIALMVSLLTLVAAPQAYAVEVLGVSTGTAYGKDPIEMAQACHATFAASRVCDSKDLKRATSIATLPAPNGSAVTLLFHAVPKAASNYSGNPVITDELGINFTNTNTEQPICGFYTQLADGRVTYSISDTNGLTPAYQVLCCSDQ